MVWCSVQNWLENGVNTLYPLITWYLCDHLWSSAGDVQLGNQCVHNFRMNSENDFETVFEFPCSSTRLWTCLSIWKMDVVGVFVPALARGSWKGWYLATGKRFHEEEGKIWFTLACYACSKIQSRKGSPGAAFLEDASNVRWAKPTQVCERNWVVCDVQHFTCGNKMVLCTSMLYSFPLRWSQKEVFPHLFTFFRVVLLSSWTQGAEGARGFMHQWQWAAAPYPSSLLAARQCTNLEHVYVQIV